MRHSLGLRSAAAAGLPAIGAAYEGGYFAGAISHTANGVATHKLIVAPAATGASGTGYPIATLRAWTLVGISPSTNSEFDGLANVSAPGFLSNCPAALFCSGLSIGGYTDWYLPSTYELQIAYENLKPTTDLHSNAAGPNTYPTAFPDTGNPYSVPIRTIARSPSSAPFQTSVAAFQSGGAEAFVDGFWGHWTSTALSGLAQRTMMNTGSKPGQWLITGKPLNQNNAGHVRAFRKVAV